MDLATVTLELQQVFALVYSGLIFWGLVFIAVATIILSIITAIQELRR